MPGIDAWTQAWSEMRTRVCREAEIDGTRPPALYELSIQCLDERRDALAGLLEVLGDSTATDVQLVLPAIAGLEQVGPCAEQGLLERRPAPPAGRFARRHVEALRRELMRVQGLLAAGRYGEGLQRAEAVSVVADGLVVIGTASGELMVPVDDYTFRGSLAAFDLATGAPAWQPTRSRASGNTPPRKLTSPYRMRAPRPRVASMFR